MVTLTPARAPAPESSPGRPGGRCVRRAGSVSTKCRCSPECVDLDNERRTISRAAHTAGEATHVNAAAYQEAVRHLLTERPGTSITTIARALDVSPRTLRAIMNAPPGRTVRRATATMLQPVLDERERVRAQRSRPVSGLAARRMVDALMAAGWPLATIAQHAGLSESTLSVRNLTRGCNPVTLAAMTLTYGTLRGQDGPSEATRKRALRAGFATPAEWGPGARIQIAAATPALDQVGEWSRRDAMRRRDAYLRRHLNART